MFEGGRGTSEVGISPKNLPRILKKSFILKKQSTIYEISFYEPK